MAQNEREAGAKFGMGTIRETKYDAHGNMDAYRDAVQRSMEKPYPDNGGFYGVGSLREMGLRRSRHSGDWRSKSEFQNKEEEFVQPLKGTDTVLFKGTTIRGAGGLRIPTAKTGGGGPFDDIQRGIRVEGGFQTPAEGLIVKASSSVNVSIIRSLGKSLAMPKSILERRTFDEVQPHPLVGLAHSPPHANSSPLASFINVTPSQNPVIDLIGWCECRSLLSCTSPTLSQSGPSDLHTNCFAHIQHHILHIHMDWRAQRLL